MKVKVNFLEIRDGKVVDTVGGYAVLSKAGNEVWSVVPDRKMNSKLMEYLEASINELVLWVLPKFPDGLSGLSCGIDVYWFDRGTDIPYRYYCRGMLKAGRRNKVYEAIYTDMIYCILGAESISQNVSFAKKCAFERTMRGEYEILTTALKHDEREFNSALLVETRQMLDSGSLIAGREQESLMDFWHFYMRTGAY